jgi:predicted nucleotidyltransferase
MERKTENITNSLREILPQIKSKYHVVSIALFGSFVKNQQTQTSDLDILVTFSKAPSLFKFLELENHLSEKLGVKVDLVMKSALKPNIGKRILSEAQPI